jgi:hypothetical protein
MYLDRGAQQNVERDMAQCVAQTATQHFITGRDNNHVYSPSIDRFTLLLLFKYAYLSFKVEYARMIIRNSTNRLAHKIDTFAAVGLIGPRQVGKTTLALEIGKTMPSQYLDLENPLDLLKIDDPFSFFQLHADELIILDEIQRKPELFPMLRGVIDENRRRGHKNGQFLILGSASVDLLRQSSESLAGRIIYEEIEPLLISEFRENDNLLWVRGGYPESLLVDADRDSLLWRQSFISTYLERDIPFFSPRIPSTKMRRLWTMLAHHHGQLLNVSTLAASLSISNSSVSRYIDLLEDLFLIHKLQPWYQNTGKRLTKSPKVYIGDTGILHALLNIPDMDTLMAHPVVGASWESFVIQNIKGSLPDFSEMYFYRTSGGAEIDLLILLGNKKIAIEIKKSSVPKLARGFYEACKDIEPDEKYVIYTGQDSFYMKHEVMAISLKEFIHRIST